MQEPKHDIFGDDHGEHDAIWGEFDGVYDGNPRNESEWPGSAVRTDAAISTAMDGKSNRK